MEDVTHNLTPQREGNMHHSSEIITLRMAMVLTLTCCSALSLTFCLLTRKFSPLSTTKKYFSHTQKLHEENNVILGNRRE